MEREKQQIIEAGYPKPDGSVLTRTEFANDLGKEIENAKERVWLRAMYFKPNDMAKSLEPKIIDASRRGLDVRIITDHISLMIEEGLPTYLPLRKVHDQHRETLDFFENLRNEGVDITFTNPPTFPQRIIPYLGRNHIKMSIVDDVSYIGGINFTGVDNFDFMVKMKKPEITSAIASHFDEVNDKSSKRNTQQIIDDEISLLLDGGIPNDSIIYNKACDLVEDEQESLRISLLYLPDGEFLETLVDAQARGVKLEINTSHFSKMTEPADYLLDRINAKHMLYKGYRFPINFLDKFSHGKIIVGSKKAIYGSHNYSIHGVRAGTEEIALETTNPEIIKNLNGYLDKLTTQSS